MIGLLRLAPVLLLLGGIMVPVAAAAQASPPKPDACQPRTDAVYLQRAFAENYGIFRQKEVDWDAVSRVYARQLHDMTDCARAFALIGEWLQTLNDHHVFVWNGDAIVRSGTVTEADTGKFSLGLVRATYLQQAATLDSGRFVYGWVGERIGYIHLSDFYSDPDTDAARADTALLALGDARGIILDVRNHGGGYDRTAQLIASRFADRRRLYQQSRIRVGPAPEAFSAPRHWQLEPLAEGRESRPTIVLTGPHSMSAAENFVLAMRVLPNVLIVGERTAGVFADIYTDHLPGGWQFAVPYTEHLDHLGRSWEGVGLIPDVLVSNSANEVAEGRDRTLELARKLLLQGLPAGAGDVASAALARPAAAAMLARRLRQDGVAAMQAADALRSDSAMFPGVESEYLEQARMLEREGRIAEALALAQYAARTFLQPWRSHEALAVMHARLGAHAAAAVEYRMALEVLPDHNAMLQRRAARIREQLESMTSPRQR